ncbi:MULTISPECIES: hypothetical protein [unclassified Paenibacillus]|uniref:hypothetical protein n=1 Tax=unclassified Paenibacillus TaxID=185978 RepID=UPI001358511D|nr:hypothetical protein [Paenibacillus sp. USDA918EY]
MKKVMVRAWEIAKAAVAKFGGKAKEYFSQALTMAWKEVKAVKKKFELELKADTKKTKTWVAEITGTHPVYKLARKFLNKDWDNEYGEKVFRLNDGFYEFFNGKRKQLFQVVDGEYVEVDLDRVLVAVQEESRSV